jgi:hypothetical protein
MDVRTVDFRVDLLALKLKAREGNRTMKEKKAIKKEENTSKLNCCSTLTQVVCCAAQDSPHRIHHGLKSNIEPGG